MMVLKTIFKVFTKRILKKLRWQIYIEYIIHVTRVYSNVNVDISIAIVYTVINRLITVILEAGWSTK